MAGCGVLCRVVAVLQRITSVGRRIMESFCRAGGDVISREFLVKLHKVGPPGPAHHRPGQAWMNGTQVLVADSSSQQVTHKGGLTSRCSWGFTSSIRGELH